MQDIWLERFRPKTLDDIKGNREILVQFKNIVADGSIPNMILSVRVESAGTTRLRENLECAVHRETDTVRALLERRPRAERE